MCLQSLFSTNFHNSNRRSIGEEYQNNDSPDISTNIFSISCECITKIMEVKKCCCVFKNSTNGEKTSVNRL